MRYRFDDILLDTETGELSRNGESLPLRRQAFRLLEVLVSRAPALIAHDELLDTVWGHDALSPNVLPQTISELRQALGDRAQSPRYIETLYRRGYRLIPVVSVSAGLASGAQAQTADEPLPAGDGRASESASTALPVASPPSPASRRAWWRQPHWFAAIALLLASLQLWMWMPSAVTQADSAIPTDDVIALGRFPVDDAVPDWVSGAGLELLSQSLSHVRGIRLLRSDVLGVPQAVTDARWQAMMHDLLGAPVALTGHWRARANGLRLEFSLIDLNNGQVIDASHVEGPLDDFDQLVSDAGNRLLAALDRPVSSAASGKTGDPEARDRYWRALALLQQGEAGKAAALLQALRADHPGLHDLDASLVRALRESGQSAQAGSLIHEILDRPAVLPLGERLRLEAEAATLDHQPGQASAALRALLELDPNDSERRLQLAGRELDALQAEAARTTIAHLQSDLRLRNDPRLALLRARLARISGDLDQAAIQAGIAQQVAEQHNLTNLVIDAVEESAKTLQGWGELDTATGLLENAEQQLSATASPDRRIGLTLLRMALLREQGKSRAALALFESLTRQAHDPTLDAQIRIQGALTLSYAGRIEAARSNLDAVRSVALDASQPALAAAWHNAMGVVLASSKDADDIEAAQQAFSAAFSLARRSGLASQMVALQVNAGLLLAQQRRLPEAEALWTQALDVFERLGDRRGQATCLGNLASVASMQGLDQRAVELNQRALTLFTELDLSGPLARTAYNLGLVARRSGRLDDADALFVQAADAWRNDGQLELYWQAIATLAELRWYAGEPGSAEALLDASGEPDESISALRHSHLLSLRARLALDQGETESARHLEQSARQLRVQSKAPDWVAASDLALLNIRLFTDRETLPLAVLAESLAERFAGEKQAIDAAKAWLLAAEARLGHGEPDAARQLLARARAAQGGIEDKPLSLDIAWVEAWTRAPDERVFRLATLRTEAASNGFRRLVRRIDQALGRNDPAGTQSGMTLLLPYAGSGH